MATFRGIVRLLFAVISIVALAVSYVLGWIMIPVSLVSKDPRFSCHQARTRLMSLVFKSLVKVTGIELITQLNFKTPLEHKNILFLSNHVSYLDIVALTFVHPMGFIAKKEVGEWPVLGRLIRRMGTIFVLRESMFDRFLCIRRLEAGLKNSCYCVFPEGTTTDKLLPDASVWKAGHLHTLRDPQTRVVAVGIQYLDHKKMAWIDNMTLTPHLWKVLKRKRIVIALCAEEVIVQPEELQDLRKLSHRIRSRVNHMCITAEETIYQSQVTEDTLQNQQPCRTHN